MDPKPETTTDDDPKPETTTDDDPKPETAEIHRLRAEAARWRARLREVEAERDRLADVVARDRREQVERIAADRLAVAGDVWLDGGDLDELLDEDGRVSPELVAERCDQLVADRPGLAAPTPPTPPPARGPVELRGGVDPTSPASASWAQVLAAGDTGPVD